MSKIKNMLKNAQLCIEHSIDKINSSSPLAGLILKHVGIYQTANFKDVGLSVNIWTPAQFGNDLINTLIDIINIVGFKEITYFFMTTDSPMLDQTKSYTDWVNISTYKEIVRNYE